MEKTAGWNKTFMERFYNGGNFLPGNQISAEYRYIESIRSMRKPVISSEISPKIDGFKTCDFLPVSTPFKTTIYIQISYFSGVGSSKS